MNSPLLICKVCGKEQTLDSVCFPSKDGVSLEMIHNDCVRHLGIELSTLQQNKMSLLDALRNLK